MNNGMTVCSLHQVGRSWPPSSTEAARRGSIEFPVSCPLRARNRATSPHCPTAANIEAPEQEFRLSVVTAGQVIVWEALRGCGIKDAVSGYGLLLRELLATR
jgi:hypothetical protein